MSKALLYRMLLVMGLVQSIYGHQVYRVGDEQGWNPNVDYKAWSAGKTFHLGDVLEFNYKEGLEVQEVTAKNFEACNNDNVIFEDHTGKTFIPLRCTGSHYFTCGVYNYCKEGMKLNITVT
ncbi:blue copper protein-like [Chenopodium quinoa]|uniref:Phytocyanin domain-containing protein n=1 Tax=Chenopodium quinoa TaxID=63459 RepID=A0A803LJ26_CHEQI|nr:blue copper protein-like [Chenopodium quinoa]